MSWTKQTPDLFWSWVAVQSLRVLQQYMHFFVWLRTERCANQQPIIQAYFDSETHRYNLTTDSLVINSALIHTLTLTTDGLSGQLYMCTLTTDGPVILTTSQGQKVKL